MDQVYDRVLTEVGNENTYQKRHDLIYHFGYIVVWGMAYMNMILAFTVTPYECKIPEKPDNVSELDWKIRNIPRYKDVTGRYKFDSCLIYTDPYKNNNTNACSEYVYDKTWYEKTVPSEYDWVCEKELYSANIMAYTKFGESFGSVFFGWFSDAYGRRYAYIVSTTMLVAGRLICILAGNSYLMILIGCLIGFFPSWTASQSVTVIGLEMASARHRTKIARLRFTAYSFGMCILGLAFWWIRDWRMFVILTTAPIVPYLLMSWKITESPRWLYTQGRLQESLKILKRIAKINKRKIDPNTETDLLNTLSVDKPEILGILALFSSKRLALNTTLQLILWVIVTMNYVYLVMSAGEKTDSNPFLDFAWQAVSEIPAVYVGAWLADRIGRRYTAMASLGVTTAMWISITIRENSADGWIRKWWIGTLFNIVAKFSATSVFLIISILTMEFNPTCIRQTGMAVTNFMAGVASVLIPYLLFLGRRYDPRTPSSILAILTIVAILAVYILPETLNVKLPETLEEAQNFGRRNKKENSTQLEPLKDNQHV